MISIQKISKSFGTTKALNQLSFEVQQGEIIGFLGPNGAGKTTMMRVLAGLLEPDEGQYLFDGRDAINEPMTVKRRLGYLAENNPLEEEMIVSEYLQWIASMRLPSVAQKEAIDRVIGATEIRSVVNRPISELSKGYRQRVGLSQAILSNPDLLILDEPTEGLDPNQRVDLRSLIKNLGQQKTVLISTHVLSEVTEMCSRLLIIDQGKLVADGSVASLQRQVQHQHRMTVHLEGSDVSDDLLLAVPGVVNVISKEQQENRISYVFATESSDEVAPNIFRIAKERGWILSELHQEKMNLEQLFRQFTQRS